MYFVSAFICQISKLPTTAQCKAPLNWIILAWERNLSLGLGEGKQICVGGKNFAWQGAFAYGVTKKGPEGVLLDFTQ